MVYRRLITIVGCGNSILCYEGEKYFSSVILGAEV